MADILRVLIPIVVVHLCALVAIIFIVKRLLLRDSRQAVTKIKQVEAEVRKKEEAIRREIEDHEREFTEKKAQAEAEIEARRETAKKEISSTKDTILADAKKEGDQIVEQARRNEEKFRKQIAQDMEEKAVDYGGQIFRLVFSEEMNAALNKQFINELLEALDEVDAASITVDSSDTEFISSHPLDPEQKARLESLLKEKFSASVKVEEKINEDLLAGLIFKLGSLEIDGSLLNRYHEAVGEVKKTAEV